MFDPYDTIIYITILLKMLTCGYFTLFTRFFRDKMCSETLHSFYIRSIIINSYAFTADLYYIKIYTWYGAVLQIGRSLVRFQMVSLEFFIDIILPIAPWPWGHHQGDQINCAVISVCHSRPSAC